MAVQKVVTYGHSALRAISKNITDFSSIRSLIDDLIDTMYEFDGIGLAANQIGINTDKPENSLDVNGTVGINTRVGIYKKGEISADGKWYKIIDNLDGLNIFEITARIDGKKLTGQYSLLHAIALSAYGGKRSKSSIVPDPFLMGRSPAQRCSSVDFPAPFGPFISTISP